MIDKSGVVSIRNDQMIAVSKSFFVDGMSICVPVYLKIKEDNFLLICKKGEKANFTNLHSFKNPTTLVFVKKEDHSKLIHHMTDVTEKILGSTAVSSDLKAQFLLGLTDNALQSFDGKGLATIHQLQQVSSFIVMLRDSVTNFDEALALLANLPNDESKHAMTTCMVALMICNEMQLNHKAAQEKLALGCLLHDVGLKFLAKVPQDKARHLWTNEENDIYETHPIKSVEMLRDLKDISNDVLLVISEHHENSLGTGFPKKIRDIKISPLGKIAGLADCFSDLLFGRIDSSKKYDSDQAIKYIEDVLGQPFNKQVFLALKNVINRKYLHDKSVDKPKAS